MFSDADRRLLEKRREAGHPPATLTVATTSAPQSAALANYATALAHHLPGLTVRRTAAELDTDPPALRVTDRLHYLATPQGPELAPFLAALLDGGRGLPPLSAETAAALSALPVQARLEVFISPHCPFCPATVSALLPVALAAGPQLLSVIDGALFPDLAAARDIRTAPTVILDGGFRWSGKAAADEVVSAMARREPARLGAETLRGIIEDGMADTVARMMVDHGGLLDNLIPLLAHDKWPVRLGAMVVMENFQALRPDLATAAADRLWPLVAAAPDAVKGDLLHVIGETGDLRHAARLETLAAGDLPPEIREAAADALAAIRGRMG
jgi:hypothetical protein